MWLSLVERSVRDAEAAGSNPAIPTAGAKRRVTSEGSRACRGRILLLAQAYQIPPIVFGSQQRGIC